MKIVLATRNKDKVREMKEILRAMPVKVFSMLDLGRTPNVREDKRTFRENAAKKAAAFLKFFLLPSVADDSGLEVDVLQGAPGIRSARFAGRNATKEMLCNKVLKLLKGVPPSKRTARFVCNIALALPEGKVRVLEGIVEGRIASEMRGKNGFGYDAIFVPRGHKRTFAQMKPAMKNRLSHRARALKKLKALLRKMIAYA
jgi:XTP/dITP diphosphohydrolase